MQPVYQGRISAPDRMSWTGSLVNILNSIKNKLFKPSLKKKEDWEFQWQSTEWADLYKIQENKDKVLEYWVRYRFLDEIKKRVVIDESSYILDVGCGISTVLHYLPGHRYGIDPLGERYKTIYNYPDEISIQKAYGESIPFDDSYFDVVTCSNCIDHMSNPEEAVSEIRRVLKSGGYCILTCEVYDKDHGVRNIGHPHSMTVDKLYKLVDTFEVISHWNSPWIGLKNYVSGNLTGTDREQIFLLKKV